MLAKYFNSEIHILGLWTTSSKDIRFRVQNYVNQVEDYLTENGIKFKSTLIDSNHITEDTINFAEEIGANLISIMTEQETTAANLLLGSYSSQMVNHSSIPVLSIHASKY